MTYTEKIEAGLILWLKEVHGEDVVSAYLTESEIEKSYYDGCETCGYGGEDDKITTYIGFTRAGKGNKYQRSGGVNIEGTSINFLPTLLDYIDRASAE